MSAELSGRELDRAIAEALGWEIVIASQSFNTIDVGNVELVREGENWRGELPNFHSSLDALKAVEPYDGEEWSLLVDQIDSDLWHAKAEKLLGVGNILAWGETEPLARARALLKWLTREGEG